MSEIVDYEYKVSVLAGIRDEQYQATRVTALDDAIRLLKAWALVDCLLEEIDGGYNSGMLRHECPEVIAAAKRLKEALAYG